MELADIEMYLTALGDELQRSYVQKIRTLLPPAIRILIVGGAFMRIKINHRRMTNDIDVLIFDDNQKMFVKDAVHAVGKQYHIPPKWLNDVIGDALLSQGPVPEGTLWRRFGVLEVYLPPADYILALKILSGRDKDIAGAQALLSCTGMTTRDQVQNLLDQYIPDKRLQHLSDVSETLDRLF